MVEKLFATLKKKPARWKKCCHFFQEVEVPAKSVLLREGEVARYLYLVRKGCLRICFNNDGKEITFQFFFEHQGVSSIESYLSGKPSLFSIESIEPSTLISIRRDHFDEMIRLYPELKDGLLQIALQRLINYANLFLSRIKDTPRMRYEALLREHPEILQRVPLHYIASYLGITPVSLSRIRNKSKIVNS